MNPDLAESQRLQQQQQQQTSEPQIEDPSISAGEDSDNDKPARRSGRRKIKIEYIEDKNRRHITFSKRKAGIMKKAYELSTLTGTQVLLLVVSETGLVYTFTTVKLQPIVTKPEGKNLIQACLNAPDPVSNDPSAGDASYGNTSPQVEDKKSIYEDMKNIQTEQQPNSSQLPPQQPQQQQAQQQAPSPAQPTNASSGYAGGNGSNGYQPQQPYAPQPQPGNNTNTYNGHPGYMNAPNQAGPYQPAPPQNAYGQMPQPAFYGNQQPHYMQQPPPQQPPQQPQGYWQQQQQQQAQAQQQSGGLPIPKQNQSPVMDNKSNIKK
ncbi:MAG: hypothetical protein EXX96DRAFT_552626 [Benjaminiella poitrasii]|nr:MAG: hypothetical protein EXX96DRAFT_552626 [Benjaminiella poitrasii]